MNKQITVFSGCVIRDGKILMVQRNEPECPDAHLKWEFPGGKVQFGETAEKTVIRELEEETGVHIKINQLLPFVQTSYWNYAWGTQQTLCLVFLCTYVSEDERKPDHHVKKVDWVDIKQIEQLDSLPGTSTIMKFAKEVKDMAEEKKQEEQTTTSFKIRGDELVKKVKEFIEEGNVRKITIKDKDDKVIAVFPLTFGVVGALVAPMFAAIGAIAALVTECSISVERTTPTKKVVKKKE